MDLVEVVLRSANAQQYLSTFQRYNITTDCLKLLGKSDLEIMGIEDVELQDRLLKHFKALVIQIPGRTEIVIDSNYIKTVLEAIDRQLYYHYNNFVLSAYREDIIVDNVTLSKAGKALEKCVKDLQVETEILRRKANLTNSKKKKKAVFLSITSMGVVVGLLVYIIRKQK